jgi:glycosyltransferase involved in cell wall biosynthesis
MTAKAAGMRPITVCVPVYNAAAFVEETLDHVARQSHQDMRVRVSVDLSPDDSVARCRRFAGDPRFEIIAQPRRLGWIDNINFLIDRVETDDFSIIPHDDLIEPDYLAVLQAHLDRHSRAAVAFTDIVAFGELTGGVVQRSITGGLFNRVMTFLVDHFDAVAFRGVVRRSRAGPDVRLRKNPHSSYGADTLWMLRILVHGELARMALQPGAAYRKRYRIGSQHHRWLKWNREVRTEAWIEHCAQCGELALSLPFAAAQKRLIVHALMQRAIKRFKPMGWPPFMADLSEAHRSLIQSCLAARLAGIGGQEIDSIARLRALPEYQAIAERVWGRADTEPIGHNGEIAESPTKPG